MIFKGKRNSRSKAQHTAHPSSTAPQGDTAPQNTARHSKRQRHPRAAPPSHRAGRDTPKHTATHHSTRHQQQRRPNRHRTTRRAAQHSTANTGKGPKPTPPAKEDGQQGSTARHHTATQHHRTQDKPQGSGHHNKPQHTAGRQAKRPGRRNRDNTRQRKTTAGNQTQQRTAGNHRQQHTAPAGANKTTRHHQQDTTQTAPHRTTNDHQSNAAPHPRREHKHGPRQGTKQRQQGAAAQGKNHAQHRITTQHQAEHKTHHDTAARQATTHTEQAQPGSNQ